MYQVISALKVFLQALTYYAKEDIRGENERKIKCCSFYSFFCTLFHIKTPKIAQMALYPAHVHTLLHNLV